MTDRLSFVFYRDWYNMLAQAPKDLKLALYDAILRYAFEGKEPQESAIKLVFSLIKQRIDADCDKWEDKCDKRRKAAKARWKKEHNANAQNAMQNMQMQNLHYDNVNGNDCVNGNGNVNVNGTLSSKEDNVCVCDNNNIKGADASHTHTTDSLEERRKETYNNTLQKIHSSFPQVDKLIMPTMDTLSKMLKDVKGDWALFWDLIAQMENNPKLLEHNRYLSRAFKSYLANNK